MRGLTQWLWQRFSAVVLVAYSGLLITYFGFLHPLYYAHWHAFFSTPWIKGATLLAVLSIMMHAWIGVWTIATDYLKCTMIRQSFLALVMVALMGCGIWSAYILWSLG